MHGRKTGRRGSKQHNYKATKCKLKSLAGGDRRHRSQRITRRFSSKLDQVVRCFEEYISLVANLVYEKQKLLQITNIISEEMMTYQGIRKEKYRHIMTTGRDWAYLFEQDARRIPNDTAVDKRLLSNDEDNGRGTGILDIAGHERESFLVAADRLLAFLRNATSERELKIASGGVADYIQRVMPDLLDNMNDIETVSTMEESLLFPGGLDERSGGDAGEVPDLIAIKRTWGDDDIDKLAQHSFYGRRACGGGADTSARVNDRKKRFAAIQKLVDIYARSFSELVRYLPSQHFQEESRARPGWNLAGYNFGTETSEDEGSYAASEAASTPPSQYGSDSHEGSVRSYSTSEAERQQQQTYDALDIAGAVAAAAARARRGGNEEEAATALALGAAVAADPQDADAFNNLGRFLEEHGDHWGAEAAYRAQQALIDARVLLLLGAEEDGSGVGVRRSEAATGEGRKPKRRKAVRGRQERKGKKNTKKKSRK
jgi:hypothetical protein